MKISAYICGKDQGLTLRAALESLRDADEVIYSDSGSTDDSLAIAESCGATVLFSAGITSGSEHRNHVSSFCKHPWAVWLSPDDVLEPGGIAKIKAAIKPEYELLNLKIVEPDGAHSHNAQRCYRTDQKWIGRRHEYLASTKGDYLDVTVQHTRGPWHDNPSDPENMRRCLLADIADYPSEPRWVYLLARDYMEHQEYEQAVGWFSRRLRMGGEGPEMADAFFLLALSLYPLGRIKDARQSCVQALALNANFENAALFMAGVCHPDDSAQWERMASTATNARCLFVRG